MVLFVNIIDNFMYAVMDMGRAMRRHGLFVIMHYTVEPGYSLGQTSW